MYIDYDVADRIATITLNRPEAANAQNAELLDELDAAWTRAAEDSDVVGDRVARQRETLLCRPRHSWRRAGPRQDHTRAHHPARGQALSRIHAALAQCPEAVHRRGPGPVHLRRPAAVLAVRPDHRRRRCAVLRPGGADGHRRRRIPRPHLGTWAPQGQGDPLHGSGDDRRRGAEHRNGQPGRAARRAGHARRGRWPNRSPRCRRSRCARPSGRSTRPWTCRVSTRPSSRCSTSTRPATATR